MIRKIFFIFFIISIAIGSVWLFVLRTPKNDGNDGKVHIIASFYPLAYIASIIGGDFVSVRTLAPAGAEPHDFELSPQDFIEIGKADILFYNGAGFEPWVKKWETSSSPRPIKVVDESRVLKEYGVTLINRNGMIDPHFWLDPVIFKKEVEITKDALILADPAHQGVFSDRALSLTRSIDDLDKHFQKGLALCSIRSIVVSHDAFGYLGTRYGISVTSISGISPDEEPAPKDLARISTIAREKNVKYIFSETIANPKFSEAIAREIDGVMLILNPLESLTQIEVQSGEDYFSKMEMNLTNLKKAMSCQ